MASKEVADLTLRVLDGTEEFHLVAGVVRDGGGAVTNHGNSRRTTLDELAGFIIAQVPEGTGGDMLAAANLSDLTDDAAARANLGVYSIAEVNALAVTAGGNWWKGHMPTAAILATVVTGGTAQAVTVADDPDVGLTFDSVDSAAGENFRVRYQATPSNAASWSATCRITANMIAANSFGFGMFLGTSDANKWASTWLAYSNAGTFIHSRRIYSGGFLANDFQTAINDPNAAIFLRIRWDQPAARYSYEYSFDGKVWRVGGTRTIAELGFAPDKIGLGCYVNNATAASKVLGSCDYWVIA